MNQRTCTVSGCDRQRYGHGMCQLHWRRQRKNGTPADSKGVRRPVGQRFWGMVEATGFCWVWIGTIDAKGYGHFRDENGSMSKAHRWAYGSLVGEIPEGFQLDHLCRNRSCVNPDHLEPVTPAENSRRGISGMLTSARHAAITHCPSGHQYTADNTYVGPIGKRQCRACNRQRARDRKARASACNQS